MCGDLHVASLAQPDTAHDKMLSDLRGMLEEQEGPKSPWPGWVRGIFTDQHWYNDFTLMNLVWLLGNAFSEGEMRLIVEQIIAQGKQTIRKRFPKHLATQFAASSVQIVSELSKPELLQIGLISSDIYAAATLDRLIDEKVLKMPATEVRRLKVAATLDSWTGAEPECSAAGLRVIGNGPSVTPLSRLKRLIIAVHQSEEAKAQLKWFLRHIPGQTIGQQLEVLINREDPKGILCTLIVNNIAVLKSSMLHLQASYLDLPKNESEEARFVEKLLWKLGFQPSAFDSPVSTFRRKLEEFREVVVSNHSHDGSWITRVRSAGVNLFVSLESLLSQSLSFACWVFLSDPLNDKHVYNNRVGAILFAQELSGLVITDKGPIIYDENGKNTMFPLIVGFTALAKRVRTVLSESEKFLKPRLEYAHYYENSALQLFPYTHKAYICDATPADVDLLLHTCEEITTQLQQSKVFEIRNKLEHNNEDLPNEKEMAKCAQLLDEVVKTLEGLGLLPIIYANRETETDGFGRVRVTSQDGGGRLFEWEPSPALRAIKSLPAVAAPQIMIPGFRIPETNEPLRFKVEHDSEFTKMWQDYPKYGSHQISEDHPENKSSQTPAEEQPLAAPVTVLLAPATVQPSRSGNEFPTNHGSGNGQSKEQS